MLMGREICQSSVIAPQPTTAASRCEELLPAHALMEAVYAQAVMQDGGTAAAAMLGCKHCR